MENSTNNNDVVTSVYTLEEIKQLSKKEINDNWEKVKMSLKEIN